MVHRFSYISHAWCKDIYTKCISSIYCLILKWMKKKSKWIIKNDVWSYSIIVPDDGYSRNASCAVNFISTFLFQYRTIYTFVFKRKCAGTCIRGVINMDLFSYTKVKVHELMDTQKLNYQINYHGKNLFNRVLHHTL